MTNIIDVRPYRPDDNSRLADIWHGASAEAHAFLPEELLIEQKQLVAQHYLPHSETWVAELHSAGPVGFIGLAGSFVGGLFVDRTCQGKGVGRLLMDHALNLKGSLELEVYALNERAMRFYQGLGFIEVSRSPTDDQGLPYATVRMRR